MPERAYIALGSNIQPEHNLIKAVLGLKALGTLLATSSVYQNPAIGREDQPDYLNAAVLLETDLPPAELRSELRKLESKLGRVRSADRYAARTIDLDLCLYGHLVLITDQLTLPDPDIAQRAHLALTLSELDPLYRMPASDESLDEIAQRLKPGTELKLKEGVTAQLAELLEDRADGQNTGKSADDNEYG